MLFTAVVVEFKSNSRHQSLRAPSLVLVLPPVLVAMDAQKPPSPPAESTDIFSLSDQVLSDRLHFIEEASMTFSNPLDSLN